MPHVHWTRESVEWDAEIAGFLHSQQVFHTRVFIVRPSLGGARPTGHLEFEPVARGAWYQPGLISRGDLSFGSEARLAAERNRQR
jgi:hypothetical protein